MTQTTNILEIYWIMFPWFLLTCGVVCLLSKWDLPKYTIHYSKWGRVWLEKENNGKETHNNGKKDVETGKEPKEEKPIEVIWEDTSEKKKAVSYDWEEEGEWRVRKEVVQD